MRRNLTALPDKEWAERLIVSFAKEARMFIAAGDEFTAAWYARECVRIARQFLTGWFLVLDTSKTIEIYERSLPKT